jgi:hypothetical protein
LLLEEHVYVRPGWRPNSEQQRSSSSLILSRRSFFLVRTPSRCQSSLFCFASYPSPMVWSTAAAEIPSSHAGPCLHHLELPLVKMEPRPAARSRSLTTSGHQEPSRLHEASHSRQFSAGRSTRLVELQPSIPVWCLPGRRPLCCRSQTTHPNLPEFLCLFISLVCMLGSETCANNHPLTDALLRLSFVSNLCYLQLFAAYGHARVPWSRCPSYISWTAFPVSVADNAGHQELITSYGVQERGLRSCTEATKPCILVQTCSCRWWHHGDRMLMW